MSAYFITGTDTDVGKSVAAAWCMLHLKAAYWKPVQSGLEEKDIDALKRYTGLPDEDFLPSIYELTQPLSPHESARRDGIEIDMSAFSLPASDKPLVIEGAGGLMVPLNTDHYVIDLIKQLDVPAILIARSMLGTINHTLLSIEALQKRNVEIAGIILNGPKTPHNRQALEEYARVPIIAEIDHLDDVNPQNLMAIKPEINLHPLKEVA